MTLSVSLRGYPEAVLAAGTIVLDVPVTGVGEPIVNGYLTFSGFQGAFDFIPAPRQPDCAACGGVSRASASAS